MKIAFVVTTVGRTSAVSQLLEDLVAQLWEEDRVILVVQSNFNEIFRIVSKFAAPSSNKITIIKSDPGASVGRNQGVKEIDDKETLLFFPNDTTRFHQGIISRLHKTLPGKYFGCLSVLDEHGPKSVIPEPSYSLTRRNVWSVLMVGLFVRLDFFEAAGGFDETLGTGSSSPWRAGEETDLTLRINSLENAPVFHWLPKDIFFDGVSVTKGLSKYDRRAKLRSYGRGIGYVYKKWKYPLPVKVKYLMGSFFIGMRSRGAFKLSDAPWALWGRVEGLLARTFGKECPSFLDNTKGIS